MEALRHHNPILTNVAIGHVQGDLVYPHLFPTVKVTDNQFDIPTHGKDHLRIVDGTRAMGGQPAEIQTSVNGYVTVNTKESTFVERVDRREITAARSAINGINGFLQMKARYAKDIQDNVKEKVAADLATTAANYANTNVVTKSGTSQWSHADAEIYNDLVNAESQLTQASGYRPDLLVIGEDAYNSLRINSKFINKVFGTLQTGVVNEESLSSLFKMKVVVARSRVWDPKEEAFVKLWGDNVVMAHTAKSNSQKASQFIPAFGYNFEQYPIKVQSVWEDEFQLNMKIGSVSEYAITVLDNDKAFLIRDTVLDS